MLGYYHHFEHSSLIPVLWFEICFVCALANFQRELSPSAWASYGSLRQQGLVQELREDTLPAPGVFLSLGTGRTPILGRVQYRRGLIQTILGLYLNALLISSKPSVLASLSLRVFICKMERMIIIIK